MTIKYLKKSPKQPSTDDVKTREIVQKLLSELEKSREEGCKELTKKFDKYDGDILISKEKVNQISDISFSHKVKQIAQLNFFIFHNGLQGIFIKRI